MWSHRPGAVRNCPGHELLSSDFFSHGKVLARHAVAGSTPAPVPRMASAAAAVSDASPADARLRPATRPVAQPTVAVSCAGPVGPQGRGKVRNGSVDLLEQFVIMPR